MAPNMTQFEEILLWCFVTYVLACTASYLILNMIAFFSLRYYVRRQRVQDDAFFSTGTEPPISVVVPAYNEAATIVASLQSVLQLDYPNLEIVIVNDGSKDKTLEVLKTNFDFEEFPEAPRLSIPTKPIKQVYLSRKLNNLRLVDKENGGKADAINAGINLSRSPLFCCIDADSVLESSALLRVVQPFINDPKVIAAGGTVRVANGCVVRRGNIIRKGIPRNPLALFQMIEYLRAFLFGRIGWSKIQGLLIISGAFGLFRKENVVQVGGYHTATIGEDMELILRLYRAQLDDGELTRRIEFIPDPVCWTEAPETLKVFASQRRRWHRGLSESLYANRKLLFHKGSKTIGWVSYPFFIIFEWLSPFIELAGYLYSAYLLIFNRIDPLDAAVVAGFAIMLSVFLSTVSFLLDEFTFPGDLSLGALVVMLLFAVLECLGYRQLNMVYKIQGTMAWLKQDKPEWGEMVRSAKWQK